MATIVKKERKEKKKSRERSSAIRELSPVSIVPPLLEELVDTHESSATCNETTQSIHKETESNTLEATENIETISISVEVLNTEETKCTIENSREQITSTVIESNIDNQEIVNTQQISVNSEQLPSVYTKEDDKPNMGGVYHELGKKLERMVIPTEVTENITEEREDELVHPDAYLCVENEIIQETNEATEENALPSAPCFEEIPQNVPYEELVVESKPRIKAMPLEDALKLCGGKEMDEVRTMSEREEEIVEAGPQSGPEHPLVDLLSTFRSSLIAVERERIQLACGYTEEEKSRNTLWKIEKRHVYVTEKCQCGLNVELRANYEHAELVKERLPIAKLRLEGLLRDVQDSYCHHQHAALLAHCQIEELISETIQSNKIVIREALSLILQALRLSDTAPTALASALQRWAVALSAALIDNRDLRQMLFLMHHLFRQSRSVQWASRVVQVQVDSASPYRVLALLELLLARARTDPALECTEDTSEVWEEVDAQGGGGAVSEGTLRERDLLALLTAFPLRTLVARLVLFTNNDITRARPHEWGDSTGGSGVLRACCGVRTLLHIVRAAINAHSTYVRLCAELRNLAAHALKALACLHLVSRPFYSRELEERMSAELEAAFSAGFELFDSHQLHRLPATLLADDTVKDYCVAIIVGLHDKSPKQLKLLSVELPVLPCEVRVRMVAQTAIDRTQDHELARIVLDFLLQTGLKRKSVSCKAACDVVARECVGQVLDAHAYLHPIALYTVAELNMVETLEPSCVKILNLDKWRPNSMELLTVLDDWARRCQQFLPQLLLELDYTPYAGLPLDVQLSLGSWLCSWVRTLPCTPEWCWQVFRRLRTHRSSWGLPLDAPAPAHDINDLFGVAYALISTSWGHCIPLICSEGVSGLCKLAVSRARDAVHCLSGVMLVMAQSPESVAFTPKFNELFTTLLSSGPSLVQRALGRGGVSGSDLLLRLILAQLTHDRGSTPGPHISGVLRAWLQGCWRVGTQGLAILDTAATATRLWPHLDDYAAALLQEENAKEYVIQAVRNASSAPLLCECLLRAWHGAREAGTLLWQRLLATLQLQRAAQHKIHVDNALQKMGAHITSDELVIYRAGVAAMSAPVSHPSHLTLWRLLMHLYLQTPPDNMSTAPVGPLFYSGLIKSRTLNQIKRRLQETITYHHNEAETLKTELKSLDTKPTTSTKSEVKSIPVLVDDSLLPALSIVDLTGESSASDSEDNTDDRRSEKDCSPSREIIEEKKNISNLISYHVAAERLLSEYLCWLEEGEKVRAAPHYADIARFIPEQALEAAWKRAVSRPAACSELDEFPLPVPPPAPDNSPPKTPFNIAVNTLLNIKDHSHRRRRRTTLKSPVDDADFTDARTLISLVDKHLKDIERLAQEWCTEVSRVSSLDARLWELVSALRVRRQLPPVRKHCANNCKPITIYMKEQEWCISVETERGVRENRSGARAALRRLARPRPHAAKTAAALHSIIRRTRSSSAAIRVVERLWRCAGARHSADCAPAAALLTTLVAELAERWICHDGRTCTELLSAWGKRADSCLQQTLCGGVVAPRRLPAHDWPRVYTALLDSHLPSHTVFSYLSKFEMSRWSENAEPSQRRDLLEALVRTVQRWGPSPGTEHNMLVELLGVHSAVLLDSRELCAHIVRCANASLINKLPPAHWIHVVRAVDGKAVGVPFDQLGHLLRELGVMWWEARTGTKGSTSTSYEDYAAHVARLLHALQRAFVAAATRLSYEPQRVSWYAWSSLRESWGAWITPHPSPPLLPSTVDHEHYTHMLRHFVDSVHQVMLDCPGSEVYLLQHIFEWCVQTYMSVQGSSISSGPSSQESQVQASALLAELANLPWSECQWFYGKCLQQALQISTSTDRELTSWCSNTWRNTTAETLIRDTDGTTLAPRLAELLCLTTGTHLPHSQQLLEEVCKLPWYRLPEPGLDEAVERFFMVHHNPAQPYHDLPGFRVISIASELVSLEGVQPRCGVVSSSRRARAVSHWVRAASAPALVTHVSAHTRALLRTVTLLAPYLENSESEIEELLSRAVVIMCIEPAATAALPVWTSWVSQAPLRLVRACVSAVAVLTAFEYFATLADAATKALLASQESPGWHDIITRWSSCPWTESSSLIVRGRVHAAYAVIITHPNTAHVLRDMLSALLTADLNFVENEQIVGVWICLASRVAMSHSGDSDVWGSARALVGRWGEQPRRSLLRVVTMYADTDKPTALHRVLCRYALCVLSPSDDNRRAYESACSSTLGANSDVITWAASPQLNKLVRLAIRLWPKNEKYFQYELEMAPEAL